MSEQDPPSVFHLDNILQWERDRLLPAVHVSPDMPLNAVMQQAPGEFADDFVHDELAVAERCLERRTADAQQASSLQEAEKIMQGCGTRIRVRVDTTGNAVRYRVHYYSDTATAAEGEQEWNPALERVCHGEFMTPLLDARRAAVLAQAPSQ